MPWTRRRSRLGARNVYALPTGSLAQPLVTRMILHLLLLLLIPMETEFFQLFSPPAVDREGIRGMLRPPPQVTRATLWSL